MNRSWMILLMAVLPVTGLAAQIHMGADAYSTVEIVDSGQNPTNNQPQLKDPGDILIGNGFDVDVIVEIWADGIKVFEGTIPARDFDIQSPHNLPPGQHEIRACDAGNPPPQPVGTVCVG